MFTSNDIGPWVQETSRDTARAVLAKVLMQKLPALAALITSLQHSPGFAAGFSISDEQDALQALYAVTEPGLEWSWDGLVLKLADMRTLPADKVAPAKL